MVGEQESLCWHGSIGLRIAEWEHPAAAEVELGDGLAELQLEAENRPEAHVV